MKNINWASGYDLATGRPNEAPEARFYRTGKPFLAAPGQGVNYAPGVWHHPLLALDAVSDFWVIDRAGPGDNCEEITLAEPVWVLRP